MSNEHLSTGDTIVIFFPFQIRDIDRCYLLGDFKCFDDVVKIFFITKLLDTFKAKKCLSLFTATNWDGNEGRLRHVNNWIYLQVDKNVLSLKKLKIQGEFRNHKNYHILWINYDFELFSKCETLTSENLGAYNDESYFKYFYEKISEKINNEKRKKGSRMDRINSIALNFFSAVILKLSFYSTKLLPVTKYFNIALHIDSYLNGFIWALKSTKEKNKLDIKVVNFLLSVFLDMLLGIMFLKWLNSKLSLDSSPTMFLYMAESVVNSIKELITWLRGDPAGFKLNWAFNKVLAMFYSFHIDIWWTFIAFLKPLVKIIFQIFLKLGLLGITFQASIIADLLALVSFHVYCIYAYAAKLYSIQLSALISLWRLFLGRKKNPLRGKVDSCRYSPEQLFVGTLGFTILLFLLPTTLLYYIVFMFIRLSILMIGAILLLIRYFNKTLPVYSTVLWILRSPKVSAGVKIDLYETSLKSDFILLTVTPVTFSWWETVNYFTPDCVTELPNFTLSDLLTSLISGKLLYPV